jgi:hypothetical protein
VEASPGLWQGKNDPMNGGEGANATNCFPQYTGYHGWKIQNWSQSSPTITSVDGVPGVYTWDPDARAYLETGPVQAGSQNPVAIDVPVATVVGALAHIPESSRIYTPIYWSSGNVFAVPEATEPGLPEVFEGATYYLKIEYADGTSDRMLIARPAIEDTDNGLYLFSVNVELDRNPTQASLYQTMDGYPDMDFSTPSLLHTIEFEDPIDAIPEPILLGRGFLANGALRVTEWCEPGLNCTSRDATTAWRWGDGSLHFTAPGGAADDTVVCGESDGYTSLTVPIVNEDGESDSLILHAQRTVQSGSHSWAGPINDTTAWIDTPNVKQGLRVWIPYEDNSDLATGTWTNDGDWTISAKSDGAAFAETPIQIALTVLGAETINMADPFEGPSVTREGSSSFFSVADGTMGPTSGVWWGSSSVTPLTVPVRDGETDEMTTLQLDAWKRSCNLGWGTVWSFNSAQAADGACGQWPNMRMSAEGNEHLVSGHTYTSPPSWPLVVRGHAWHWGQAIVETTAYQVEYTAP